LVKSVPKTRVEVAGRVGLAPATYARHKRVLDIAEREAPDLMPHVESGEITISKPPAPHGSPLLT